MKYMSAVMLAGWLALPATAAFQFFNPVDTAAVPHLLSQTGLYTDIVHKVPDTALKYFDINSALWSDGAAKQRWLLLPPGKHVTYVDSTDFFDYPDSAVFVKTFLLDRVDGDSTERHYWETRLLVHKKDGQGIGIWHGFSYRWNTEATDARLVDLETGFDTAFHYYPKGLAQPQSYKKWHFPTRQQCNLCHLQNQPGLEIAPRTILGFFPPQLKRPAPLQPGISQITWLFNNGVFTGTPPTLQQLARHWKDIHDPIPSSLTPEERFRVIDTMARSYIAANCSGCHSQRGISSGAPQNVNYDFYDLTPRIEFGLHPVVQTFNLDVEDSAFEQVGRLYYLGALRASGLDTGPGAVWDMAKPASGSPSLLYPGFPSYSTVLYRQWVRRTPARDSIDVQKDLTASGDPQGWRAWLFSEPWGSTAWFALLTQHGVDPGELLRFNESTGNMPPVPVSFTPNTEAMKILGEWVKTYRTLYVVDSSRIITGLRTPRAAEVGAGLMPLVRNGMVLLPEDWKERPELLNVAGQRITLMPVGKGRYALPAKLPSGIYYVRAGTRSARIPILHWGN